MLLNCERNLANGPRFLPSGKRLGPYFCNRAAASAGSRPFAESVVSRPTTSSGSIACQATTSLSGLVAFAAVPMLMLHEVGSLQSDADERIRSSNLAGEEFSTL